MLEILDMLDSIPAIEDFLNLLVSASALLVIMALLAFAAAYVYQALTLMYIGRKGNLTSDWMPFVPVANSLYALKLIGEQWWKMFFFDGVIVSAVSSILFFIFARLNVIFAVVLLSLYFLCCFAYYIYYMYFYYKAFGVNPVLIIAIFAGASGPVNFVLNLLIAYTNLFSFGDSYGIRFSGPTPPQIPVGSNGPVGPIGQSSEQGNRNSYRPSGTLGSVTCLSGMYSGNTFNLVPNEELVIGRNASVCNIVLERNADKVSRKHCSILYNPSSKNYFVTDYSSNGTLTGDGARLVNNIPTQLPSGTVVCLGNNENRFMLN